MRKSLLMVRLVVPTYGTHLTILCISVTEMVKHAKDQEDLLTGKNEIHLKTKVKVEMESNVFLTKKMI